MHNEHLDQDEIYLTIDTLPEVDLDAVKDRLYGVLEAVYKTGDVAKLEENLDELCAHLDMDIIHNEPMVQTRETKSLNWFLNGLMAKKN